MHWKVEEPLGHALEWDSETVETNPVSALVGARSPTPPSRTKGGPLPPHPGRPWGRVPCPLCSVCQPRGDVPLAANPDVPCRDLHREYQHRGGVEDLLA